MPISPTRMTEIPFPYSAESMGLKPGDRVAYRGRDVWQVETNGQMVMALWDGLQGTVKSVHDGHPPKRLETIGTAFGPFAFVIFDNGVTHDIDEEFGWQRIERS